MGEGGGVPPHFSPQGWAPSKPVDFHHLKAVQLACEWCGGLEGTVSVRTRQAVTPASRARHQLADRVFHRRKSAPGSHTG